MPPPDARCLATLTAAVLARWPAVWCLLARSEPGGRVLQRDARFHGFTLAQGSRLKRIDYQVNMLVKSAKNPLRSGGDLAQLYLERCYKLTDEDYTRLQKIEEQIRAIESEK